MADKIYKSGEARKGDQYLVYPSPAPGPESVEQVDQTGAPLASPERNRYEVAASKAGQVIRDAEEKASGIMETVEAEAARLLEETQGEIVALRERAEAELQAEREKLSTEVHAEIQKQYHARYQGAIQALEGAARGLQSRQDDYIRSLAQPAFELVLGLARHLMQHEMSEHPELLAGMISRALSQLNPRTVAKITVSPGVFQLLVADDLIVRAHQEAGVSAELVDLEMDETLQPHEFNIRAGSAMISYDFEARLTEILAHLAARSDAFEPEATGAETESGSAQAGTAE